MSTAHHMGRWEGYAVWRLASDRNCRAPFDANQVEFVALINDE